MRAHEIIDEDISRRGMLGGLLGAGALGAAGVATKSAMDTRVADEQEREREMQRLRTQQAVAAQSQSFDPQQYRPLLEKLAQQHGITSIRDMSNFLGQVEVETRRWATPVESLRYSTPQLIQKTFKSKFPTVQSATPFVNNPVALANRAYAGVNGNGDEDSGDGWRYRGRGFKQITGRANYAMVGRWAHPDNPDIYVNNPDLLSTNPRESALASIAFYLQRVKLGSTPQQASRRTNPGGLKRDERRQAMDKIQRELEKQRNAAKKTLREIGRNEPDSGDSRETDDVYEPVKGLIPVPQNPQYAYVKSRAAQLSLVQADHNYEFYHVKDGGARYIGFLQVRNYRYPGLNLRNPVQVSNINLTPQFRNWGVGMMMYGVVLGLGHTIFADSTQTPAARKLWVRLSQQPNVTVRGVMQVSSYTLEEMNDEDYTPYDREERQLQRLLKRSDTQFITNRNRASDRYDDWEMLSFAVRPRADGAELEAPGISIYKKHERYDEWDPVGLYATLRTQT